MVTIYKYIFDKSKSEIEMPANRQFLNCEIDRFGEKRVWAIVDTESSMEKVKIHSVYTGEDIEELLNHSNVSYIGTINNSFDTLHIFIEE